MGKKGLSVYRWTVFLPSMNHFPLPLGGHGEKRGMILIEKEAGND